MGVIGVVAAMTLPSLIVSHKKTEIESKLQKFNSIMNQAIIQSEIDNGDKLYWEVSGGSYGAGDFWEKYLKDYIVYTKAETKVSGGGLWTYVLLPDGTGFRYNLHGSIWATFDFCINAKDCTPNNFQKATDYRGSRVFSFSFAPNSPHAQYESIKNKGFIYYHGFRIDHSEETAKRLCYNGTEKALCTAVIALNNWKIPKDYPWIK